MIRLGIRYRCRLLKASSSGIWRILIYIQFMFGCCRLAV